MSEPDRETDHPIALQASADDVNWNNGLISFIWIIPFLILRICFSVVVCDENQYEAILAQEKSIEKEIADKIPLLGEKIDITMLHSEYASDEVYQKKVSVSGFWLMTVTIKKHYILQTSLLLIYSKFRTKDTITFGEPGLTAIVFIEHLLIHTLTAYWMVEAKMNLTDFVS